MSLLCKKDQPTADDEENDGYCPKNPKHRALALYADTGANHGHANTIQAMEQEAENQNDVQGQEQGALGQGYEFIPGIFALQQDGQDTQVHKQVKG
jgi:hypothetical protein